MNREDEANFKAGIYIRLSREDENADFSESIQNQRAFLEPYVNLKGWVLIDIYSDDGFTGTNFNRPEFKRMIKDIKCKKINLVITKDLSRLGRDYIETGYYIEKFFPENNIRYIAVNDGIDTFSDDSSNDMNPFRSVINDMYAKDISKKVRTVMDTKRKNGKFVGAFAPFGYRKSNEDKNILEIDEEEAVIVKRIYGLYISGNSFGRISCILNEEGVESPGAYKRKNNLRYNNPKVKNNIWTSQTIKSILTNPTYAGNITQNKYKKINYKVKKIKKLEKEAWITVENTHEPIIDQRVFSEVQKIIDKKAVNEYCKANLIHVLSGMLFCGDCGERMTFTKTNKGESYCICSGYKRRKNCTRHSIKEIEIEECIKNDLQDMIKSSVNLERIMEIAGMDLNNNNIHNKKIKEYEGRLSVIKRTVKRLYEDRIKDIISEEDFLQILCDYNNENKKISRSLEEMKTVESKKGGDSSDDFLRSIVNFDVIDKTMLLQIIDRIFVYENKKIQIFYKFSHEQ